MDMSQYRELFVSEARGHLARINELVVHLERSPDDQASLAAIFRAAHSLKGMAATMSYHSILSLSHAMEDLLARIRSGAMTLDHAVADLLLEGSDQLSLMIDEAAAGRSPEREVEELRERLVAAGSLPDRGRQAPPEEAAVPRERAPVDLRSLPLPAAETVRVRTRTLDRLIDLSGELLTVRHRFASIAEQLGSSPLAETVDRFSGLLRELHGQVLAVRMLPLSTIVDRLPRMVRDLARQRGREVEFTVKGAELELDRSIIDHLAEPLVHMLRNAVDHGLESGEERTGLGKSPAGTIGLSFVRDQDHLVVTVEDDGRGMEPERLVAAAVSRGLVTPQVAEALSREEAFMLICLPGFSTARAVTEVSGRGVGMDAVLATAKQLGGRLAVSSTPGHGTRMQLRLPISVAIVPVLLVAAGHFTFGLPVRDLLLALDVERDQILTKDGRPCILLDGEVLPLISLNRVFGLPLRRQSEGRVPLFVAEAWGRRQGFLVDGFRGQQEVFVKPLGSPLSALPGIGGATMLGDGRVVYVLDLPRLRGRYPLPRHSPQGGMSEK